MMKFSRPLSDIVNSVNSDITYPSLTQTVTYDDKNFLVRALKPNGVHYFLLANGKSYNFKELFLEYFHSRYNRQQSSTSFVQSNIDIDLNFFNGYGTPFSFKEERSYTLRWEYEMIGKQPSLLDLNSSCNTAKYLSIVDDTRYIYCYAPQFWKLPP